MLTVELHDSAWLPRSRRSDERFHTFPHTEAVRRRVSLVRRAARREGGTLARGSVLGFPYNEQNGTNQRGQTKALQRRVVR